MNMVRATALPLLLAAVAALILAQTKQGTASSSQMSMGVLAVTSDHEGALFVDGERKIAVSPDKIVTLRLVAGQHFVDLRDSKGSKLWEKVVDVPAGAQVAERIGFSKPIRSSPDLTMTMPQGEQVSLASYRGKVVAVEFLLLTCHSCIPVSQSIETLYRELGASGFQALAVSVDDNAANALPDFVSKNALSYPIGRANSEVVQSYLGWPTSLVFGVPQLVILDRTGDICAQYDWQSPVVKGGGLSLRAPIKQLVSVGSCNSLPVGSFPASSLSPIAPVSSLTLTALGKEIDDAERSGRTTPLPAGSPCAPDSSLTGGLARYEVKNSTAYDLRVILSGPSDVEVRVPPSSSRSATLPAATYKVLGKVNSQTVLPFFGTRVLPSGNTCGSDFYIEHK